MIVLLKIDLDSTTGLPHCPGNPHELTPSQATLSAVPGNIDLLQRCSILLNIKSARLERGCVSDGTIGAVDQGSNSEGHPPGCSRYSSGCAVARRCSHHPHLPRRRWPPRQRDPLP